MNNATLSNQNLISHNEQTVPENTSGGNTVLILGATGGFGGELTQRMAKQGWQVSALTRKPRSADGDTDNVNWIVGDLDKPETLIDAAKNVDVIVHAVNVPYQHWNPTMVNYTRTIIDLARNNNAHLMFVGNVYNAGIPTDGWINERTPNAPINEKGELRAQLEHMIEAASNNGLRSTIMRFGDFFGPNVPTTNWFNVFTKAVAKNKLTIAGDESLPHTWAYLPDAAQAFEQVAAKRVAEHESPNFMVFPFAGHVFSPGQLKETIESITTQKVKVSQLPWAVFKLLGWVITLMRDIESMRYLWQHDIQMDGTALSKYLGVAPEHTALEQAVLNSVPGLADASRSQLSKQDVSA